MRCGATSAPRTWADRETGVTGLRHRRRLATTRGLDGPLGAYYRSMDPSPNVPTADWRNARFLCLDIETTGFDPRRDHLLSAGWIRVDNGSIDASSARHGVVTLEDGAEVGQSAATHRITDTEAADGRPAGEVLDAILGDLAGRVLVCHFAQLEISFLDAICRRERGQRFWPRQLVDSMQWHLDLRRRAWEPVEGDDMRLYSLIDSYGLPATRPHNGLSDAFATAMLLLAMAQRDRRSPTLESLLDKRSW